MFKFNFQTKNKTRLSDSRTKTLYIERERDEMCKTNMKTDIYYVNLCKHEHVKNITKLWCKIVLKTSVEQTKGNERSYSYLYPFGNLTQINFQRGFYVCIK